MLLKVVHAEKQCEIVEKMSSDPRPCCNYPVVGYTVETGDVCLNECTPLTEKGVCCFNFCMDRETGIFVNDTFSAEKLIETFINTGLKEGLSEKWTDIVTTAVLKCQDECALNFERFSISITTFITDPKTSEKDIQECEPSYFSKIVDCATAQIFLNCPNYQDSKECKQIKKTIKECVNNKRIANMFFYFNRG